MRGGAPADAERLSDSVAAKLRERIVAGDWPVGSRIPTEPVLAELAGVGRNTIREAVQSLVHAGLLRRRQGSGTYVVAASELPAVIGRQLEGADQRDVLEVRQALEVSAVSLAALRRTPDDVTRLSNLASARRAAVASADLEWMALADVDLHRFIATCSKNPVLIELYDSVLEAVRSNIAFNFDRMAAQRGPGASERDAAAHEAMIKAVLRQDSEAASRVTVVYLQTLIDALTREQSR
jgi:DNA-binding FadR family transcriptional regulator